MAKPIELALSQVWNHKSIERLNATELGAYVCLCRAILIHGFDPLPTDRDTLQRLSRLTRRQWERYRERITQALNDTVKVLRDGYQRKQIASKNRQVGIKVAIAAQLRQRLEEITSVKPVVERLVEDNDMPLGMIQPHLAARYQPKDYDKHARNKAIAAKSDIKPLAD